MSAQGKEQRDAALGSAPPQNPSPEGAAQIPLAEWISPRTEKAIPSDYPEEPYLGLDDVEAHTTHLIGSKSSETMKSAAKRFYPGDVLYSRLRPYLNKVWLADRTGLCSAEFIVLPSNGSLDGGFLKYRLSARDFVSFANSLNAGDRPRVDFEQISVFSLPPYSRSYQRRIVAKIEELFSELDAGEESLRRARRQLGAYRQSLLKQAFEGKLTAPWRKQNPHLLESSDNLLNRIQAERQARYAEELKVWEAAGRNGSKPKKPITIQPFAPAELVGNPVVPDVWIVMTYGDLCSVVRNGISRKPSGIAGHKIARISSVRPMAFDLQDYRFLDCSDDFASDFTLRAGDLVFTRYNGARRFVGVCARFPSSEPRLYPDKLIRTCPDLPSLDSRFLEIALNTGLSRAWLETKIRTTAGQSGVSGGDVKAMPVPLCSLPEQREIVRLLDEQFTVIEQNEREIDAALKRSAALRQSILKKAFTGHLVPQDATDEPASALLERIRKEREVSASVPKKKIARKRAKTT
jgi:type I restriction enzyme S subunit